MRMRGFSLIEILVAITLLAFLGVFLMTSINSSMRAKDRVEQISEKHAQTRQAINRMAREIAKSYLSKHISRREQIVETAFKGTEDKITFTAFNQAPRIGDQKISDQSVISYFLGKDQRTDKPALLRRQHYNLSHKIEDGGLTDTLCLYVIGLEFRYWDANKKDWINQWDSTTDITKNKLPERVKITMTVKDDSGVEEKYSTQTQLWVVHEPIEIK